MKSPKIYMLFEPDAERYVGLTTQPLKKRLSDHITEARRGATHRRANWIRSVLARGESPQIKWVDAADSWLEGCALEAAYLQFYRDAGYDLVNGTPGGTGTGAGEESYHFGKKHSQTWCENQRRALIGKPLSVDHCKKLSEAHLGIPLSPEHCEGVARERRNRGPAAGAAYKGVVRHGRRWGARILGRRLGSFDTPEEAARARDDAARKLWGNDCYFNFL